MDKKWGKSKTSKCERVFLSSTMSSKGFRLHLDADGIVLTPTGAQTSLKVSFPTGQLSSVPANRKPQEPTIHVEAVAGILPGLHGARSSSVEFRVALVF